MISVRLQVQEVCAVFDKKEYQKEYNQRPEVKEYLKEYYKKNKDAILKRAKEWNERNKEARKLIVERDKRNKLKPFWVVKPTK